MKPYTNEEVWEIWKKNPESIYQDVVSGHIWTSELFSKIDVFTKKSLTRKAFRYVAEESTKGTIPATLVANHLGFHKMKYGETMPIGVDSDFPWASIMTFTDKHGILIQADLRYYEQITFRSIYGQKTVDRPTGTHMDFIHTCIDIPMMYNDERYHWEINSENYNEKNQSNFLCR